MYARSLVQCLGDHQGPVLGQPARDVVGAVAMRLSHAQRNRSALRKARLELGIGVALDPECWRNQYRSDHPLRGDAFRGGGFDVRDMFGRPRLDIDQPLTHRQIEEYAAANLDGQLRFDPTIFQCPGHVPSSLLALENDFALAEATLDLVRHRALREPREDDQHERRRSVFATVCVRSGQLNPGLIREIVKRYAALQVDGFWVWVFDFQPSGIRAEMAVQLTLALQQNSGRPAAPGGLMTLWQAALARGAAAALTGQDRGSLLFTPEQLPPSSEPKDDEKKDGRQIPTYHGAILSYFGFDARGERARGRTFHRNHCGCGFHLEGVPPRGRTEVTGHNQWWRLFEARRACLGSAAEASQYLQGRFPGVRAERLAAGIKSDLKPGWRRSLQAWDRIPVGWGAADGRAATG